MLDLDVPIVLAPLAGGPATVALAAAVTDAGGLGFLAAGYRTADALAAEMAEMGDRRFGVNVFAPPSGSVDAAAVAEYAAGLDGPLGEARRDDDEWDAKLALLRARPPAVVSFVFGLPSPEVIASLPCAVWVTVTSVAEALAAVEAGADALVAQGYEAGGHRGGFADDGEAIGTLALVQLLAARVEVPIVAAGGVTTGAALAAVLAAGAGAAAIGTGFLRAGEAGTNPAHRAALAAGTPTALTRAFTGKPGRGIVNDFMRDHPDAPAAYPELHYVTAPLRAEARAAGDASRFNLWAGQAHELAVDAPAAEIVATLMADARAALGQARRIIMLSGAEGTKPKRA